MRTILLFPAIVFVASVAFGQDFEAVQPNGQIAAKIAVSSGTMQIRMLNGQRFRYRRDRPFDTVDGRFVGYFHPTLNRVLRFPRSGNGFMMMADLDDLRPFFRRSTMVVRPARHQHLPPGPPLHPGHLPGFHPGFHHGGFVPIYTPGLLGAGIYPAPWFGYGYYTSGINLIASPPAAWHPGFGHLPGRFAPQSVIVDSRLVPGPPLEPVAIGLRNGSNSELIVTITDLRDGSGNRQVRIPAGEVVTETFNRESVAEKIDTYETYRLDGSIDTHQVAVSIAPQRRYELTVHQWRLQSIAIDRTGKSPNMIEDVNYQGKGLGRFPLPAGEQLRAGTIDVYRAAIRSENAGAVAPLIDDSSDLPSDPFSGLDLRR
ncbi:hypothetical protein [Novipirellula artificiosorum]|uniref:SLA1 homology domain-containing protein n=1 Tax=Novipirellula artificiosorum TaxID=2528016 RepID=A0A5C6DTM0_9BACT|nr:hypothetical protein [Novipirellula artificiosorum]TWU39227.1 hypothetical protein Poly41_20490 [Novipirellula artificiosorum]